jgi:hypothetical protein
MNLPISGQRLALLRSGWHDGAMPETELVSRVADSTGLSASEAARVVADVVAYYAEPAEVFVRRRHGWLKTQGMRNPEIFAQIHRELVGRVVAAPDLTERQIRRIIYG